MEMSSLLRYNLDGDKMKCPKCGMTMSRENCLYCGYMLNGNVIDTKKLVPLTDLDLYFDQDYDKITRNQNWFIVGLLGPSYIFSRGFYLIGLLLIFIDSFISFFFMAFNQVIFFSRLVTLFNVIYIFINRVVWATIGNMIYIKLQEKRIEKFREKNPNDYRNKLQALYKKDKRFLKLKYFCFGLVFFILFIFIRTIAFYYLRLV